MWLGVLQSFLKPICLVLVVIALFLPLYNMAVGKDSELNIGKYTFNFETIMRELTNTKFEPFLFTKVTSFVEYLNGPNSKLGSFFDDFTQPTGSDFLDTLNQLISFVLYDGIKIAMTISAYLLLLIDFAIFIGTSVLKIFGNLTGFYTL